MSKYGQYAHDSTAAEAPGTSKAPARAPDQPDMIAVLARLALGQVSIDEAAAPATPSPKETVTVVRRTDVFVISHRQQDLAAEIQLLPLDPMGVLKPAATQTCQMQRTLRFSQVSPQALMIIAILKPTRERQG